MALYSSALLIKLLTVVESCQNYYCEAEAYSLLLNFTLYSYTDLPTHFITLLLLLGTLYAYFYG